MDGKSSFIEESDTRNKFNRVELDNLIVKHNENFFAMSNHDMKKFIEEWRRFAGRNFVVYQEGKRVEVPKMDPHQIVHIVNRLNAGRERNFVVYKYLQRLNALLPTLQAFNEKEGNVLVRNKRDDEYFWRTGDLKLDILSIRTMLITWKENVENWIIAQGWKIWKIKIGSSSLRCYYIL
jgi:hypothetical protein